MAESNVTDWAIVHRETGEVQFVKGLGGIDEEQWEAFELDGEPQAYHDFVDGQLVENEERRRREEEEGLLGRMSVAERHEYSAQALLDRLAAVGVVTEVQRANL